MAKASVKQRAPAKRAAAPSKAAKPALTAKPAAKSASAARKPAVRQPVARKPAPAKKPAAKAAKKVARAVKAVTTKSAVTVKSAAPAKPVAKPAPAKAPAKSAPAGKSIPPVVAKPAPAPTKAAPAPAATKPVAPAAKPAAAKGAEPAVVEAPKPSGRPMLSQGPFVSSALTKRGTFAPNKLIVPPPKPRRPIEQRPAVALPPLAPPPPPIPAVRSGDKAQKNRAGLSPKDLDFFRDLLLAKRRELLGDMSSMEREALREGNSDLSTLPIHMADQGTDAYEQEFTLGLVEKDRTLLREINNALAKIQNGTYGICEGTGLPISKPRLEAQPWAKYSIEHARALEKRQMMFRR